MKRNEVLTFQDPYITAKVKELIKIDDNNWYKAHFNKLIKIYVSKFNHEKDTPADKFVKAMKLKLLLNEKNQPIKRVTSKRSIKFDFKTLNIQRPCSRNEYRTFDVSKSDIIKTSKMSKSSSERINLFRKISKNNTPVKINHNVTLLHKYGSDEHLTKRWMKTFSSFNISFCQPKNKLNTNDKKESCYHSNQEQGANFIEEPIEQDFKDKDKLFNNICDKFNIKCYSSRGITGLDKNLDLLFKAKILQQNYHTPCEKISYSNSILNLNSNDEAPKFLKIYNPKGVKSIKILKNLHQKTKEKCVDNTNFVEMNSRNVFSSF